MKMKIDPNNPPDVYEWDGPTGVHFREVRQPSGTYYRDSTPTYVVHELERARRYHLRVRLFYGDKETGRDWGEEFDTMGYVGRTCGPIKSLILLLCCDSRGGCAILTDCIVRLYVDGIETYRHPKYHQPEYEIGPVPDKIGYTNMKEEGYTTGVYAILPSPKGAKVNVANFKSEKKAKNWIAFMKGERMKK